MVRVWLPHPFQTALATAGRPVDPTSREAMGGMGMEPLLLLVAEELMAMW